MHFTPFSKICVNLRNLRTIALVLLCGLFFVSTVQAELVGVSKVITWNLCWFPGRYPKATAEEKQVQMVRAQAALKEMAPRIFLCQEVASWQAVEELTSVVPGLKPAVVSDFEPGAEGVPPQNVGIATTYPVISGWAQKWNADGRTKYPLPRGFAFAAIQFPEPMQDNLVLVYSVHLKSNHKGLDENQAENIAMREEASKILRTHVKKMQKIYSKVYKNVGVVVGGDFNTSLDDERFKDEKTLRAFLDDGYSWGFAKVDYADRITIPGSKFSKLPPVSFDHFFYIAPIYIRASVLKVKGVSDHQPVEISYITTGPSG